MFRFIETITQRLETLFQLDIRYILRGNFWLLLARVVAIGSGILLSIAFANLLTPESFGFYKYILSLAGIVTAFSLTGIGTALVNSIARGDEGTLRTTLFPTFRWGLLAGALSLGISAYYFFQHNTDLGIALLTVAISMPLTCFGNYRHLYVGRQDFKESTLVGMVRSLVPIALMIGTILITKNILLILASYFISNTLTITGIYFYTIIRYRVPRTATSTESTLRFARFTSILGAFNQISSQIDQFLVWHFVGVAGVAFYSFATSPVEQLQSISGNIFSLTAPRFVAKSENELRRIIPKRMLQMLFVVVPIALVYIIGAPLLFHIVFPKYQSVVWLSQLYALILLLQPAGFVDAALIAREDTQGRNFLVASGQVLKLIYLIVGIYTYGVAGGVAALILSEITNLLISLYILKFRMKPAQ